MRQLTAHPHRVGLHLRSLREFPKETHHAYRQKSELPRQLGLTVTASDRRIDVRDACQNCGAPGPKSTAVLLLGMRTTRRPDRRMLSTFTTGKRDGTPRPAESGGTQSTREPPVTAPLRIERGRIAAEVDLGGHVRLATIDAGASRSFISQDIADVVSQPGRFALRLISPTRLATK